ENQLHQLNQRSISFSKKSKKSANQRQNYHAKFVMLKASHAIELSKLACFKDSLSRPFGTFVLNESKKSKKSNPEFHH
ncbi:MAG: hypothetical protein ACOVOQ_00550, partial [Flavobacterium sp.]